LDATRISFTERIKTRALELGFDAVGIAPAKAGEHLPFYLEWLAAGYHGEQSYLARPDRLARRQDLQVILPGVQSLVVVGLHYWPGSHPPEANDPARGRISCYAQGTDYHHVMQPSLEALLEFIRNQAQEPVRGRVYVDTGPLLERDHAQQAGLGFIGKNCSLIQPQRGSWLFLGELLLDIPLEPDRPADSGRNHKQRGTNCGTCTRCQEACPTGALTRPYTLDSRRCISYLTTALKGAIPREFRPLIGNQIFGCDICQEVCPWNRFARPRVLTGAEVSARPIASPAPPLIELIALSEQKFQTLYGSTPIGHIKHARFLRNVAVALGNWGSPEAVPALGEAMKDPSPLIREHVAWALGQIEGKQAQKVLVEALAREREPTVAEEIDWALNPDQQVQPGYPLRDRQASRPDLD